MQDKNVYPTFNAVESFHKLRAATKEAQLAKQAKAQEQDIQSDLCARAGIVVMNEIHTGLKAIASSTSIKFLIESPGILGFFRSSKIIGLEVRRPCPLNLVFQVAHKKFVHCACWRAANVPMLYVRPLTHDNCQHDEFWTWMTHEASYQQPSVSAALTALNKLIISYEYEPSLPTKF